MSVLLIARTYNIINEVPVKGSEDHKIKYHGGGAAGISNKVFIEVCPHFVLTGGHY